MDNQLHSLTCHALAPVFKEKALFHIRVYSLNSSLCSKHTASSRTQPNT